MAVIDIVDRINAIQYTGSNSAEIDAAITYLDITSESGGVLHVESPPGSGSFTINTNDWIKFSQGSIVSVHSPSAFALYFSRNALYGDLASYALASDLSSLGGTAIKGVGIKEAPTLLLSQSTTVPVDIVPAQPNTSYTPSVQLFAASTLLGNLSVTGVSVVDADTVNVTIQNSGLVSVSGVHISVVVR